MEINITRFFNEAEPFNFSASAAERGENAGRETWANAVAEGESNAILRTPEQIEALRRYVKEFGAWEEEEIASWSDSECNALFIQLISGDMREIESVCMGDDGEIDWTEYKRLAKEGTIHGNIYRCYDGKVWYYLWS